MINTDFPARKKMRFGSRAYRIAPGDKYPVHELVITQSLHSSVPYKTAWSIKSCSSENKKAIWINNHVDRIKKGSFDE